MDRTVVLRRFLGGGVLLAMVLGPFGGVRPVPAAPTPYVISFDQTMCSAGFDCGGSPSGSFSIDLSLLTLPTSLAISSISDFIVTDDGVGWPAAAWQGSLDVALDGTVSTATATAEVDPTPLPCLGEAASVCRFTLLAPANGYIIAVGNAFVVGEAGFYAIRPRGPVPWPSTVILILSALLISFPLAWRLGVRRHS